MYTLFTPSAHPLLFTGAQCVRAGQGLTPLHRNKETKP